MSLQDDIFDISNALNADYKPAFKRIMRAFNEAETKNEAMADLIEAGKSVIVTLAMDHQQHSEIVRLAAAIKKAENSN